MRGLERALDGRRRLREIGVSEQAASCSGSILYIVDVPSTCAEIA
jgi:hypothetical protein